jgi:sec-independent protein translocase protein TatA
MNLIILFFSRIGTGEIILILAIVLLLFGGKKIPELMRGLGKGVKEFKDASKSEDEKTDVKKTKDSEKK